MEAKSLRKSLRILPASPVYNRFLPSGDHAGYSSTPSAKVTWESVVCKGDPEPFHRVPIMKTTAMTAAVQTTAGVNQGGLLLRCLGGCTAGIRAEAVSLLRRGRSVRMSAAFLWRR